MPTEVKLMAGLEPVCDSADLENLRGQIIGLARAIQIEYKVSFETGRESGVKEALHFALGALFKLLDLACCTYQINNPVEPGKG